MSAPSKILNLQLCLSVVACGTACNLVVDPSSSTSGGATVSPELSPCDPLVPAPVSPGRILGIGKDAYGTVYVADKPVDMHERVFVSESNALIRMRVSGEGRRGSDVDGDYNISFASFDGMRARDLLLQLRSGAATAMQLAPLGSRSFITDVVGDNEQLTIVDANAIVDMRMDNLPRAIAYVFEVENGGRVVLTGDMDDSTQDVHLFFGPVDHLAERSIARLGRSHSGALVADFLVDGTLTSLRSYGAATGGTADPSTVTLGNGHPLSATRVVPTPNSLPSASFYCVAKAAGDGSGVPSSPPLGSL